MSAATANPVFRLGRGILRLLIASVFRVEVEGRERIPSRGGYILVGNHLNWIDPLLLVSSFPAQPRIYFLAPGDVVLDSWWKVLIIRSFGGAVFYNRSTGIVAKEVVEGVRRVLNDGGILGIFPEGRIGDKEGELLPFHRGVGHFAVEAQAPVLPVALSGTLELYLNKPLRVRVGELFYPRIEGDSFGEQVREVTVQVEDALRGLLEPYVEPAGVVKRWRWLTRLSLPSA